MKSTKDLNKVSNEDNNMDRVRIFKIVSWILFLIIYFFGIYFTFFDMNISLGILFLYLAIIMFFIYGIGKKVLSI